MRQKTLDYDNKKCKKRRESFLERMDLLIPWDRLEALVAPTYPTGGKKGRQPYRPSAMQRFPNRS